MTRLTKTQLMILAQATQRKDGAVIVPERTGAISLKKTAEVLLGLKMVREVFTKPGMPIWRKGEDGRSISLVILRAGRDFVAANSGDPQAEPRILANNQVDFDTAGDLATTATRAQPREGSKLACVIRLLSDNGGASLNSLMDATGWLAHTTRATLTGLRKRGFAIERVRDDKLGTVYRLVEPQQSSVAA